MGTFRYGLKSMIISELDPTDGVTPISPVDVTQYVYKKTLTTIEGEGTKTEHFAESDIYASVILQENAAEIGKVTLFNFPLALKETLKGGVATTVDNKTTYKKPNKNAVVERHIVMTTKDDVAKTYARAFLQVSDDQKYNDADVEMALLTMIPMKPVDGSEAVTEKEV